MKKTGRIVLYSLLGAGLVGGSAALYYLSRLKSAAEGLLHEPAGFDFSQTKSTLSHTDAVILYRITNPSNVELRVRDFFSLFTYESKKVAEVSIGDLTTIPANSTKIIPIPVRISHGPLLGLGLDLGLKALMGEPIELNGILMAGQINLNGLENEFSWLIDLKRKKEEETV